MEHKIVYDIHNNFSRPFTAVIKNNHVKIYNNKINSKIYDLQVNKIFVGKSPLIRMTKYSECVGDKYDGNSILLYLGNNTYKYIGECIYTFEALSPIIDYVSPIGNNDVPYPYAIDNNQNIYLMIEKVIMLNTSNYKSHILEYDCPYDYYYGRSSIEDNKINEMDEFKNIMSYYINDKPYMLRFNHDPIQEYKNENTYKIVYKDGTSKILTKDEYVELHMNFNTVLSYKKININMLWRNGF